MADEAVKNSEIDVEELNPDRVSGVIWGSGIGGMFTFFNESLNFGKVMEYQDLIHFSFLN